VDFYAVDWDIFRRHCKAYLFSYAERASFLVVEERHYVGRSWV